MFVALALVAVGVVAYAPVLFGGETFVGRDHLTHTIPSKQFLADSIESGRIPHWWDGVGLGVPFAANPNHSAMYPPAWIVGVLPMPWAVDFLLVLHVMFAGIGCALVARRLGAEPVSAAVAGGCFMVGGFVSSTVVHGGPLLTLAWMPWVVLAADRLAAAESRRAFIGAALVVAAAQAAQLFAGDPSFAVTTVLLSFGVVAVRGRRRAIACAVFAAAVVGAVILAAVVVLPALYLLSDSMRSGGIGHDEATVWSMHPARFVEWLLPGVFGDPNQPSLHMAREVADASAGTRGLGPSWALGIYVSAPVLILAVIGAVRGSRATRWLAVVAGVLVILALGRYTPLYGLYRAVVMPEQVLRYPEKHLAGVFLLICVMAGVGLTSIVDRGLPRRVAIGGAAAAGAVIALVIGAWVSRPAIASWVGENRTLDVDAALERALVDATSAAIALVLVGAAVWFASRSSHRRWALPAVAALLVGHLVGHTWKLLPRIDRGDVTSSPALLAPIITGADSEARPRLYRPQDLRRRTRPDSLTDRVRRGHDTAIENSATRFGLAYVRGYDQAHSRRLFDMWHAAATSGEKLLDLYDVAYAVLPAMGSVPTGLTELARDPAGDVMLLRNERRRSRAFVAPRWTWHSDDSAAAEALFGPGEGMLLGTIRFVGRGPDAEVPDGPAPVRACEVRSPRPERVALSCSSTTGGYAVLLDAWAEGWSATVDGVGAPVERADVLVRAVPVEPGEHVIEFRYRAPGFTMGMVISLLAWLNLLVLAYLLRRTRPTQR
jgi:hypothetical protein